MDEHFRTAPLAAEPAGDDGAARVLVPRLPRRADPRRRAVRAGAREAAVVPPAARDGEQRQVGAARRLAGRRADGRDRVGHRRHERSARVLPAAPPGHDAGADRLHRLRARAARPRARPPPGSPRRQPARAVGGARVRQDRVGGRGRGGAARAGAAPHVPREPPVERAVRRPAHAARARRARSPPTSTRC